ncbi:hypothetical protein KFK09_028865 [Dendrobium nobile]|uniref:Uncharacterized protein n=1 Tax=Dendrobium nobile TaxID=94219 RepID=A0A8T3A336_DENNO|nr:hypothetical protein KFK09_028865 [Dendrobium nobile]
MWDFSFPFRSAVSIWSGRWLVLSSLLFTVSIWSGEHSASSPFTVSIWSGECGIFLFPSVLLFRSGQADGWFFLRSCSLFRSGQVSIRLLPHSLFRSGQVNVGSFFSLLLLFRRFDLVRQTDDFSIFDFSPLLLFL